MTKNVDAIRQLFGGRNNAGNVPSMPGVFPDYAAPVVRNADGDREVTMMRWGMPTSQLKIGLAAAWNFAQPAIVFLSHSVSSPVSTGWHGRRWR
jgi:putative SOS response-associated peptidase YedK